jgi:hypothetical protein
MQASHDHIFKGAIELTTLGGNNIFLQLFQKPPPNGLRQPIDLSGQV